MNMNHTDITIVLDRSGSMSTVRDDTIGGFNSFIEAQRKLPGRATVSLAQFDDVYETVYSGRDVKEAPFLNTVTFLPRGMTALLDAIGKTIVSTGERLAALPEAERPGKVLFVIITDGGENASKEYTSDARIKQMIEHQKSKYSWEFVFLGANQDAFSTAKTFGIAAGKTMTYAPNALGTASAYASVNKMTTSLRMSRSAAAPDFDAQDRDWQNKAGA